ncbi:hypothetical protein, partial [Streptococcus pneumoniae]|uniref:hypothetical protein n=1 Tax=Streptococcus pneumoniae TaxID=1313 RepID=UPI0018B0F127
AVDSVLVARNTSESVAAGVATVFGLRIAGTLGINEVRAQDNNFGPATITTRIIVPNGNVTTAVTNLYLRHLGTNTPEANVYASPGSVW